MSLEAEFVVSVLWNFNFINAGAVRGREVFADNCALARFLADVFASVEVIGALYYPLENSNSVRDIDIAIGIGIGLKVLELVKGDKLNQFALYHLSVHGGDSVIIIRVTP